MPNNADRAERARIAMGVLRTIYSLEDKDEMLIDFITDYMHMQDEETPMGPRMEDLFRIASMHHQEEKEEEENDGRYI